MKTRPSLCAINTLNSLRKVGYIRVLVDSLAITCSVCVWGGGWCSIVVIKSFSDDRRMGNVASLVRFVYFLADLNPENFTLSSARIYIPRTTRPYFKVISLSHPRLCLAGLRDCEDSL